MQDITRSRSQNSIESELYPAHPSSNWLSGTGVRLSRDPLSSSLIGTLGCIEYLAALVSDILFLLLSPTASDDYHSVPKMPSRRHGNSANSQPSGSASTNVPVPARAARIGSIFCRGGTDLARLISEEEAEGASSVTWLSLEYIVFQLSSLPPGCTRTAGTLAVFFDFITLVGDVRMGWSPSASAHHCRDSLVFLANRVHKAASTSLIPPLSREIMIIVLLATYNSSVRRTLFDF